MKSKMRMCVSQFQVYDEEMALYASQLGISNIQMNSPALPGSEKWELSDLRALRDRIEAHGQKLVMVENVPLIFYDKVILGLPGRDRQLDNYIETIRNLASIGVEIFGHHFSPTFVWRTEDALGRGGAHVTAFDEESFSRRGNEAMKELMRRKRHLLDYDVFEVAKGLTAEKLFENYKYFMDAVIPVAEQCNIKLALHPDDPPLRSANNIERMVVDPADYERAMNIANSELWGVNLCLGCCSEKAGADGVRDMIRFFGERGKLFSVHFRDVQGMMPHFQECFLGEGNFDPPEILRLLASYGFDGLIMEDHVAKLDNDSLYGHRARAHELGYIKGLIDMMNYDEDLRT